MKAQDDRGSAGPNSVGGTGRDPARLYHIVAPRHWQAGGPGGHYQPPDFDAEGFIHCSWSDQVLATAERHYAGQDGLLVLVIDAAAVADDLVEEAAADTGQRFPHLYAALPRRAVLEVLVLRRDAAGTAALYRGEQRLDGLSASGNR